MNHPNILLIHADQHRADCLGCMGNPDVKTPQIDALAADGVRHTRHYTVYPVCTPSRYSMLSGLYPHQHTGWTNVSSIPSHTRTFPKMLKQAGYHTAAVGKMHMSPTYLDVGFDELTLAEQCGVGRYEDEYHEMLADKGKIDAVDVIRCSKSAHTHQRTILHRLALRSRTCRFRNIRPNGSPNRHSPRFKTGAARVAAF